MGRARAEIAVPGPISEAERLWYDIDRWPGFVDGFHHLAKREGDWPQDGRAPAVGLRARRARAGRASASIAYEVRVGQTVEVEDPRMSGRQSIAFTAGEEGRLQGRRSSWTTG